MSKCVFLFLLIDVKPHKFGAYSYPCLQDITISKLQRIHLSIIGITSHHEDSDNVLSKSNHTRNTPGMQSLQNVNVIGSLEIQTHFEMQKFETVK